MRLVTRICPAPLRRKCRAASSRHLARADDHDLLAGERAEDFARQFHRRVADGDGVLADVGFRAHALGDVERAGEQRVHESADGAVLLGERVSRLELPQNLRFADHHGIQAGGHAKQMTNSLAVFEVVEVGRHPLALHLAGVGQKLIHGHGGMAVLFAGERHFHAITGGKDHAFAKTRPAFERNQALATTRFRRTPGAHAPPPVRSCDSRL